MPRRHVDRPCRVVIEPIESPRRFGPRWRWSVEKAIGREWRAEAHGHARSCKGAWANALRQVRFSGFRDERVEAVVVWEQSYEELMRDVDAIPARVLTEPPRP